jgi:ankyrin repeat protein
MASSRGLFWIKGNPGTGKSVLMKSAVQSMAHINTRDVVVSFFITGRGTHLQKTPLGLFRALLNGMLEYFPQYLSQLTQLFEDRGKRFGAYEAGRWNWVEKELQDFISRVLAEGTNHRPVLIFVDALDECGTEAARSLLTYFKDLMKNVECEGGQLKICFSSRHYPILGLDTIPAIWVEEGNNKDIQFVIQDLLKEVEPAETRKELEEKVLAKAQGGFQWAVLVCNKVIKEKTYGTKAQKLHRMLKLIPEALDELYSDILSDVQETERHQMLKLFRWVLFAERPLSAQELRDAISIDEDTDCRASLRNHESWSDTLADFELHVKHISRGLVEFQTRDIWEQYEPGGEDSDREAQFIHQSVADFLLNDFLCRGDQKVFNTPVGDGHHQLSRSCIKYLTLDEVLEDAQLPRYKLWSKFQLIPYAVQFLFHHIQKVEQESIPQHDLLSLIQWDNQPKQRKIASLWRASDPDSIHTPLGWPFIGATALHIIVAFGSKSAFDDILQRGATQLDGTDTDGNTPLILAIREGHKSIALALLDRTIEGELQRSETCELGRDDHEGAKHQRYQSVNVDAENKDGDTPLTISAAENVGEVALKLIEAGATLRYPGQSAALVSCAIRSRNVRLLKKLVEKNVNLDGAVYFTLQEFENGDGALEVFLSELLRAGANTSRSQQLDGTFERESEDEYESDGEMRDDHAISVASRRGQTAAVKMLLCHGISATTRNQQGETPLLIAVEETHHDTARVLLEKEPSAVELEDEDGRTALDVALASEQLDMAMCLVKEGRFSTNEGLERALYTSIRDNMLEVVKAILDKDMSTVEVRSGHNQTPLSLAAENGHEAIVMALLEKDANVECRDSFGRIPLHLAAQNGHEAIAMALLEKGANLECTDSSGQTPLSLAAQNGHEAVTNALLKKGANLECTDDSSGTPLFLAAENGHEAVIIALLKKCANMECTDSFGRTPLLLAAWNGHKAATNALLESCANMECTDSFGRTPLLLAAQNGHEAVIIALLEKGANMECTDSFSRTPLSSAAQNGHEAIAMALLEKGANLECIDSSGQTPLSLAAQNGHEAVIIALLEKGANMECTDNTSYTPLSLAAWNGHEAVTNALLEKGANLECTDRFGRSPLHLAAENGREAVAMALLKKGANVECTDSSGQTSLLLAVRNKYSLLPLQLLEKGANPNSKDRFGLTPMFWASTHGQASVIKMLIKKGAELEPTDCIGWRPLSVAAKKGHKDVVKLLLERGASTKAIDRFGQSALLLAERHEHAEIVELLVDYNTKSGFQP